MLKFYMNDHMCDQLQIIIIKTPSLTVCIKKELYLRSNPQPI